MTRNCKLLFKSFRPFALLVGACSALSADSIAGGTISFTNQARPLNTSGSISQFDTSLGTLRGIEFVVTGASMAGTVTDQFTGSPAQMALPAIP
ncbi:MAG TPA: choice-of-anchor E domain-containing protein [Bryobacteraceae bacterium]|nr:choice-of-anchor E domain-containing protein [Bryobacteraceae bacterium]